MSRRPRTAANRVRVTLKPEALNRTQEFALQQNITTLRNRVNELGVAEPIDPAAGRRPDRGAACPACRTPPRPRTSSAAPPRWKCAWWTRTSADLDAGGVGGQVPFGTELYTERGGAPLLLKKQVVLTGDRITDAQPGFDGQTGEPAVHINLDGAGARIFQQVTRENVGKRMAMVLIEKGKGEVITAPVIRRRSAAGACRSAAA